MWKFGLTINDETLKKPFFKYLPKDKIDIITSYYKSQDIYNESFFQLEKELNSDEYKWFREKVINENNTTEIARKVCQKIYDVFIPYYSFTYIATSFFDDVKDGSINGKLFLFLTLYHKYDCLNELINGDDDVSKFIKREYEKYKIREK